MSKKLVTIAVVVIALLAAGFLFFHLQNNPETRAAAPISGLVGWWKMDANDYNSSSQTFYDKSGTGHNAISANAATIVAGKIDQAMSFNGSSDWINAGSSVGNYTDKFTLSAWVRSSTDGSRIIARRAAGGTQYDMYLDATGGVGFYTGTTYNSGLPSLLDNQWHLTTVVINGASSQFYIDGSPRGSTFSPTVTSQSVNTEIGSIFSGASGRMNGSIDDARIYSRALTAQEIAQLYSAAKISYAKSAPMASSTPAAGNNRLIGYWTLDSNDINGTMAYDKSGRGKSGSMGGTVSLTQGKIRQGVSFDGATNLIQVSSLYDTNGQSYTMSAWVKIASSSPVTAVAILGTIDSGSWALWPNGGLKQDAGGQTVTCSHYTGSAYKSANSVVPLPLNDWALVTCTYDASAQKMSFYVNGVDQQDSTSVAPPGQSYSNFQIGGTLDNNPSLVKYFQGSLDDVRVYNYALTPQEVANLYSAVNNKYTSSAPMSGLVGWWKMDNQDIYYAGGGASVLMYDRSGQGQTAALSGTTTSTGILGEARYFNHVSTDYVRVIQNASVYNFSSSTPFSLSAWVKPVPLAGQECRFFSHWDGTSGYIVEFFGDTGYFFFEIESKNTTGYVVNYTPSSNLSDKFHHIVATYDGTKDRSGMRLYLDGALVSTGTANAFDADITANDFLTFGLTYGLGSGAYNGALDDVRVYNRALSAQEITQLYNSARRNYMR